MSRAATTRHLWDGNLLPPEEEFLEAAVASRLHNDGHRGRCTATQEVEVEHALHRQLLPARHVAAGSDAQRMSQLRKRCCAEWYTRQDLVYRLD